MENNIREKTDEGLVDIMELISVIWEKRIKILCLSGLTGIFSILFSLSLTDEYTAVIYLTEVKNDKETSLSSVSTGSPLSFSLPGGLGGGNGLSPELNTAIVFMKSWNFVDDFIKLNNLEVPLIAGRGWDPVSRELILDTNKYNEASGGWVDKGFDPYSPSVRWEIYQKLLDKLRIIPDKNTGVVQLSITSYSPELSLEWTILFYKLVNKKMREKKLLILNNNIANINKQIRLNSNTSLKDRLYDIQSEQIKSKVIIEASPNFVFEPIGDTLAPFIKSYPRRTSITLGLTFIGSLLVVLVFIFKTLLTKQRKNFSNL